jgi:hypothetical protein
MVPVMATLFGPNSELEIVSDFHENGERRP